MAMVKMQKRLSLREQRRRDYWKSKKEEEGRLAAQIRMQRKKPFDVIIREHIGKFADKIDSEGIVKIGTWVGLAYIIHPIIIGSQELVQKFTSLAQTEAGFIIYSNPIQYILETLTGTGIQSKEIKEEVKKFKPNEIFAWVFAFVIAGLIVLFGSQILGLAQNGIIGLAMMLIPAA